MIAVILNSASLRRLRIGLQQMFRLALGLALTRAQTCRQPVASRADPELQNVKSHQREV
jgi:hypothetical protein